MHSWEQIQKTIEYIENHISEEISIEKLAEIASLSPFYYQRLFHRLVKKPVVEYIKLRRLAKATERLLLPDKRILDIALDLGFSSHEHFTRTFKETFGMTPDEYRKNPIALYRMTKPELSLYYVVVDEGVPLITDGIVLEVNRKSISEPVHFTGVSRQFEVQYMNGMGTESGPDPMDLLWQDVHGLKETALKALVDQEEIGVAYAGDKEGYFSYFAGARTKENVSTESFMNWELPKGEYAVCSFEAENFEMLVMDTLFKAEQYMYNTWLANHKLRTDAFCAERYASHSPETKCMEVWLKLLK